MILRKCCVTADKVEWREVMKHGFLNVAAVTPKIRVADTAYNGQQIRKQLVNTASMGAKIIVFPELCITGYTCNDLFNQQILLDEAKNELKKIVESSKGLDCIAFVGLPFSVRGKLYNVAAAFCDGKLLGIVPKYSIPNYSEFYEARHFTQGSKKVEKIRVFGEEIPFGMNILFECASMPSCIIAAEICEDLWIPAPPSIMHSQAGATVIVNLSASDELTGKAIYRNQLISIQSAHLACGYIYASAGEGESTTDLVFGGHNIIAENGYVLAQSDRFKCENVLTQLDLKRLISERERMNTFFSDTGEEYETVYFELAETDTTLTRYFDPAPFVPEDRKRREERCEEILMIQSMGLKKRLEHTNCGNAVIGISGGLDSTLALLVTVKAFDMLGIDRENITAVTMPCFGTTDRTYTNACEMTRRLGVSLKEINIKESVNIHFQDIGHNPDVHDVTYENSQARERTQILMDIANQANGIVIGTGDMSELALGWATYNGDHMSMYGVNVSIPKTLVRHLVRFYSDTCDDDKLREVLLDVLDTPVSPELLPPKDGEIAQKTEDIVGPYELHDFFLYYCLRFGYEPDKIYRIAKKAFKGVYDDEIIYKWLNTFYRRFFSQQFKRSCLPDGPKVGTVAVSPRGNLRMPSDASVAIWKENLDNIKKN